MNQFAIVSPRDASARKNAKLSEDGIDHLSVEALVLGKMMTLRLFNKLEAESVPSAAW